MKKTFAFLIASLVFLALLGCDSLSSASTTTVPATSTTATQVTTLDEKAVYQLLVDAENLSGMSKWNGLLVTESGSLGLPVSYKGVTIAYSSRNKDIISDQGEVTLPDTCWIDSRNQAGEDTTEFDHLNDNWPIVLDVRLTYGGQVRTAKLLIVVAPAEGFTCDKYLG